MSSFLELIQFASNELSLPQPTQVFGSVDDDARLMISLANREGKQFAEMSSNKGGWQDLHEEHNFQTFVTTTTGDTTEGSNIITNIPDTSAISAGTFMVSGNGLPYQARVMSVDNATQVTLDRPATATGSTTTMIFGQFAYPMPGGFSYFISRTFFDNAFKWELVGGITAQEKQVLKYGIGTSGVRRKFYIKNNRLCLEPMPTESGQTIAYDFYTKNWSASEGGIYSDQWNADTDTYRLDDDCFILGLKWRFLRSKGMDYMQEYKDYQDDCQRVMSRDGGSRVLSLNSRSTNTRLINSDNVSDTGYGN